MVLGQIKDRTYNNVQEMGFEFEHVVLCVAKFVFVDKLDGCVFKSIISC